MSLTIENVKKLLGEKYGVRVTQSSELKTPFGESCLVFYIHLNDFRFADWHSIDAQLETEFNVDVGSIGHNGIILRPRPVAPSIEA